MTYHNPRFRAFLDLPFESIVGSRLGSLLEEWVSNEHVEELNNPSGEAVYPLLGANGLTIGRFRLKPHDVSGVWLGTLEEGAVQSRLANQMLNVAPSLICAKDVQGRYLHVNNALAEFFNHAPDEMIGHARIQADSPGLTEGDAEVIRTGRPLIERGVRLRNGKGVERVLDVVRTPQFNDRGEIESILVVASDRTEVIQAEGALFQRIRASDLIAEVSAIAVTVHSDRIRQQLAKALASIGMHLRADHVLLQIVDEGKVVEVHTWQADDAAGNGLRDEFSDKAMDATLSNVLSERLRGGRVGIYRSVDTALKEDPASYEFCRRHRFQSFAAVPITVSGGIRGTLFVGTRTGWHEESTVLGNAFATCADILSTAWERAAANLELREASEQLAEIARSVPGAIFQCVATSDETKLRYISEGISKLTGMPYEAVMADPLKLLELTDSESAKALTRKGLRAFQELVPGEMEIPITHKKTGERRWLKVSTSVRRSSGSEVSFDGLIHDITDVKQQEQALLAARNQLHNLTRSVPGAVYQMQLLRNGREFRFIYVSDGCQEILGVSPQALIKDPSLLNRMLVVEDQRRVEKSFRNAANALQPWHLEFRIRDASGRLRWIRGSAAPSDEVGIGVVYNGILTDVTDRMKTVRRLHQAESQLQDLAGSIPGYLFRTDVAPNGDLETTFVSEGVRDIYGLEPEEVIQGDHEELAGMVVPEDRHLMHEAVAKALESKKTVTLDRRLVDTRGRMHWLRSMIRPQEHDGERSLIGVTLDITEQKQAEAALERTRLQLESVANLIPGAIYHLSIQENGTAQVEFMSRGAANLFGIDPESLHGDLAWLRELVHPDDYVGLLQSEREARDQKVPFQSEYRIITPGGETRWLRSAARPHEADGVLSYYGLMVDITAERLAQQGLAAAERQVKEVTQALPGAVYQLYYSPEGEFEYRYLSGQLITGRDPKDVEQNFDLTRLAIHEDDRPEVGRRVAYAAEHLRRWDMDFRVRMADGDVRWARASAYPQRMDDGGTLFNGIALDVTDRKRAEEALQASKERYEALYNSTPVMMQSTDREGRILNVNDHWLATMGYRRGDVIGLHMEDFLTLGARDTFREQWQREILQTGSLSDVSLEMRRSDASVIETLMTARAEFDEGGRVEQVKYSLIDVTDRNLALRALERSEERYRAVVQDQAELICRLDQSGNLAFLNDAASRFYQPLGATLGRPWIDLIRPASHEAAKGMLGKLTREHPLAQVELQSAEVGNKTAWHQWTVRAFFDEEGALTGYQTVGRDVTELKLLGRQIRSIAEREQQRIGHDLHDGLGQELTGLSLLLKGLEHGAATQAPTLLSDVQALQEVVNRSIATTRALAQGLSPVHLERDGLAGALEQLAQTVQSVYGIPVKVHCSRREGPADLSVATEFYRIAQEAVHNAAKHARAKTIRVDLRLHDGVTRLVVSDDGTGMDTSSEGGMGLRIMRYRADLIGASFEVGTNKPSGTIITCELGEMFTS